MLLKSLFLSVFLSLFAIACGESRDKNETANEINEQVLGQWNPYEENISTFNAAEADANKASAEITDEEPCGQYTTDPESGQLLYKECEKSTDEEE